MFPLTHDSWLCPDRVNTHGQKPGCRRALADLYVGPLGPS